MGFFLAYFSLVLDVPTFPVFCSSSASSGVAELSRCKSHYPLLLVFFFFFLSIFFPSRPSNEEFNVESFLSLVVNCLESLISKGWKFRRSDDTRPHSTTIQLWNLVHIHRYKSGVTCANTHLQTHTCKFAQIQGRKQLTLHGETNRLIFR